MPGARPQSTISFVPIYFPIREHLRARIVSNELKVGDETTVEYCVLEVGVISPHQSTSS